MSKWLKTHKACPKCSSSDAACMDTKGWWYCFSCSDSWKDSGFNEENPEEDNAETYDAPSSLNSLEITTIRPIKARALDEDTCRKFDYRIGIDPRTKKPFHAAVYRHPKTNRPVAVKVRKGGKKFFVEGDITQAGLYGQHLWKPGGKFLGITEGEIDALSLSQVQGNKWPTVSLPNGAQGALASIKKSLEFVESFEQVILMFDGDTPGREAAEEIARFLTPGKVRIATYPEGMKDCNDLLKAGRGREIMDCFWASKPWRPDEIVGDDEWLEEILKPLPKADWYYPFASLNEKLRGIRRREIVTLTAGSGVGKSHMCREITLHAMEQGARVGYVALEESAQKTGLMFMAMAHSTPWIDWEPTQEVLKETYDKLLRGKCYTYRHFGSTGEERLLGRIEYMMKGLGCDIIVLDHISIVVSGMDGDNERTLIDRLMTELRTRVENSGSAMILVSHLKKADGTPHEEGGRVALKDLRGSASIAQLSDIVIGIERDQQDTEEANTSVPRVLKNRPIGKLGQCAPLQYNEKTGRQLEGTSFGDEEDEGDEDEPLV